MANQDKVVFISGGNRGLGLGFVKLLSVRPHTTVITTYRDAGKADELNAWIADHPNVHAVKYDAKKSEDAFAAAKETEKIAGGVDLLIANAGVSDAHWTVLEAPEDNFLNHYLVNALAPVMLFKAFHPLLIKRPTRQVVFISSDAGSITALKNMSFSGYGQSKAALNYSMKEISIEHKPENFTVISLNPGPVLTDMGVFSREAMKRISPEFSSGHWDTAPTTEQSCTDLLAIMDGLTEADNGKFIHFDGKEYPF